MNISGRFLAVAVPAHTDDGEVYAQLGETSNGSPQVVANFRITEGEYSGVVVTWFGFFTDKTRDNTIKSLRNMGFKGDDLDQLPNQVLDQQVSIVVEMKPSQRDPSKSYPAVRWVNSPNAGGGFTLKQSLDPTARKRLAAEMRGILKATPAVDGDKAPPPEAVPPQMDPRGDDVPF